MPRSIQHPRATVRPLIEGLGALVVLVCGLVGIPVVLATTVGWPLPHHLSGGGQVADALRSTIPDSFWPHLFASLAWIAWAYFVFSVLATAISRVRTPSGHRRRPLGRHSAAAGLVSAVITAAVVLSQLRGAPTGRIPAPTSVATAPFRSAVASPPSTSSVARPALELVSDSTPLLAAQIAKVTHTVVAGDTLWGIAETYYGNGEQWEAIYQANVGVLQPDGRALGDAHWIYPGWTLIIPSLTVAAPTPSPVACACGPNADLRCGPHHSTRRDPTDRGPTGPRRRHPMTTTPRRHHRAQRHRMSARRPPLPRTPITPPAPLRCPPCLAHRSTPHPDRRPTSSTRCPQARRHPSRALWCRRHRAPGHRGGHLRPGRHRHRRRPRSPTPTPAHDACPGPADPAPGRRTAPRPTSSWHCASTPGPTARSG